MALPIVDELRRIADQQQQLVHVCWVIVGVLFGRWVSDSLWRFREWLRNN
jgi:hypothetical protein